MNILLVESIHLELLVMFIFSGNIKFVFNSFTYSIFKKIKWKPINSSLKEIFKLLF